MGRTRLARAAYAHHVARRIGAPYTLLTDAGRLVRDRCLAGAELVFRALFEAPPFYGVAARNGAAECRLLAGDVADARELYAAAIEAATIARSRTRKPSSTASEIDNQAGARGARSLTCRIRPRRSRRPLLRVRHGPPAPSY